MVNNLSSTPYIVNKQLLEYLNNNNNGEKYGILLSKDEVQKLLDVKRPFDRPLDSNRVYPIDNIRHKKRS
jgi:hypothetical protein